MTRDSRTAATSVLVACMVALAGCGGDDSGGGAAGAAGMLAAAGMGAGVGAAGVGAGTARAVAPIIGFATGTVTGSATFSQQAAGVTVEVMLSNCPDGLHPVHIHEGVSCADAASQGMHWGPTRGEGIPDVMCSGGMGVVTYTRLPTPVETAWSVGGDATTNVVSHAFVVHNPDEMKTRIGCGVIAAQ